MASKKKIETWAEYFDYLDLLRESGVTNMYGAAPYLMEEYGLKRDDAVAVLSGWMRSFDKDKAANDRAKSALESLETERAS